jgi:hypothetical protein
MLSLEFSVILRISDDCEKELFMTDSIGATFKFVPGVFIITFEKNFYCKYLLFERNNSEETIYLKYLTLSEKLPKISRPKFNTFLAEKLKRG